jgi:hypothetical protein
MDCLLRAGESRRKAVAGQGRRRHRISGSVLRISLRCGIQRSEQVGAPTVPSAVIWKTCGVTNVL